MLMTWSLTPISEHLPTFDLEALKSMQTLSGITLKKYIEV
jgi:hypothetical protein